MLLTRNNLSEFNQWLEAAPTAGSICLIDKSTDWTSFDVCGKIRSLTRIKKVGHAGTLDPFATGLLIIALGKGTKSINDYQGMQKTYTGKIKLGCTTKTFDSEAEEENFAEFSHISTEQISESATTFLGVTNQKPPIYSAKKVKGKALYEYARKNLEVEIKTHEVEVFRFEISKIELPFVTFEIECSKGTYIRSIANDLGEKLGTGGYLSELRRTAIGDFNVTDSLTIKEFQELFVKDDSL